MKKFAALFLLVGLGSIAVAGPPHQPGPEGRRGPPPPEMRILGHAEELGLTEETIAAIEALTEAAKEKNAPLRDSVRGMREELRAMMEDENPDRQNIVRHIKEMGNLETDLHLQRATLMLDIREHLTPDQWRAVKDLRPERPMHPGSRGQGPKGFEPRHRR